MKLSILIPTYNDECLELVRTLQVQAEECLGNEYEIIVADDGSTDESKKKKNSEINDLPNCRIIYRKENVGRACIRNFLVKESLGEMLLFIDSDMVIRNDNFIAIYSGYFEDGNVYCGGYEIKGNPESLKGNLRYLYEIKSIKKQNVEKRNIKPFKDFHSSNFLAPKVVFKKVSFNENFKEYGYEDVFFGKELKEKGIKINHIYNPVCFEKFENNANFLNKTDEGMRTLVKFNNELKGYNSVLDFYLTFKKLSFLFKFLYKLLHKPIKKNLLGNNPNVFLFSIYKILKINEIY